MRDTLDMPGTMADLKGEYGLTGDELFDEELQDKLGYALLLRRGFARFISGKMTVAAFGLAIAQEWACEARIEASIAAAEAFDADLAAQQHVGSLKRQNEANARVADAEKKVDEYARTHQSWSIRAAGADMLGGLQPDEPVQPSATMPPARRRRGAR